MYSSLHSSSFEILEVRIAPAGIITIVENAPGEFTLTGDDLDNEVSIFQTAPGSFRIEPFQGTLLNPGGVSFLDFPKVTKITFVGGNNNDLLSITDLSTLTSLSMDGGTGDDIFVGTNLVIKGPADFSGGAGDDSITFDGLTSKISGDLHVTNSAEGCDVFLNSQTTVIGGSLLFEGGTGDDNLNALGFGTLSIAKGINFDGTLSGSDNVFLVPLISQSIGKLPTGESMIIRTGSGAFGNYVIGGGDSFLAGGVRFTGGPSINSLSLGDSTAILKVGKLPTGQSIIFNGGPGTDALNFAGTVVSLAGGVEFKGGNGPNFCALSSSRGKFTFGKLATGQSLQYSGGVDDDTLSISAAAVKFAGGIEFSPGNGTNVLELDSPKGRATFGKFSGGASIKVSGGTGSDTLTLDSIALVLAGGIDFSGGAGANAVNLSGGNGKLLVGKLATGQSLLFAGGAGTDGFTCNCATTTFAGGIEVSAGNDDNFFLFTGSGTSLKIGKLPTGESVLYSGGTGEDRFNFFHTSITLAGGIDFNGGAGENQMAFDVGTVTRIGKLSTGQSLLMAGGDGDDSFVGGVRRMEFKGSLEFSTGDGENFIRLDGLHKIGKSPDGVSILFNGGAGEDKVDLEDNMTLAGSLNFNGAAGSDLLALNLLASLRVAGPVSFDAGPGLDQFLLSVNSISLAKGIEFLGGADADQFILDANGTVLGDVTADLGSAIAGGQVISVSSRTQGLPHLLLKGKFTASAAGTILSTDNLDINNVSVAREISVTLGAGSSNVTIDNLLAGNTLTIDTGLGNDSVSLERFIPFGNSTIAKLASIQTGDGDDFVFIGNPTPLPNGGAVDSTRVRFLGGLTLDGGTGNDTRNNIDTENDFPGGPPTGLPTFEVIVP
jgi:hypothetical protein